jgi:hypothetical protein
MSEPKPNHNATAPDTQPSTFEVFAAQRAIFSSYLSARDKIVALAVIHHMDPGGICWPSITRIAKTASVAPSTASASLKRLVDRGWLTRQQRTTKGGDRDSTLYGWLGCPIAGVPAGRVTRSAGNGHPPIGGRVARSQGGGYPVVGHKQPIEQPTVNNSPNCPRGDNAPGVSLDEIWKIVLKEYKARRKSDYGTTAPPDRVSKSDRKEMAQFFMDAAIDLRATWAGPEKDRPIEDWIRYVAEQIMRQWFQNDGRDDYLLNRAHPLGALKSDLGVAHWTFLGEWDERLAKAAAATATPP